LIPVLKVLQFGDIIRHAVHWHEPPVVVASFHLTHLPTTTATSTSTSTSTSKNSSSKSSKNSSSSVSSEAVVSESRPFEHFESRPEEVAMIPVLRVPNFSKLVKGLTTPPPTSLDEVDVDGDVVDARRTTHPATFFFSSPSPLLSPLPPLYERSASTSSCPDRGGGGGGGAINGYSGVDEKETAGGIEDDDDVLYVMDKPATVPCHPVSRH
jgi:hypothetical protein